jgi:hypothetical protein
MVRRLEPAPFAVGRGMRPLANQATGQETSSTPLPDSFCIPDHSLPSTASNILYCASNFSLAFFVILPQSCACRLRLRMRYDSGATVGSLISQQCRKAAAWRRRGYLASGCRLLHGTRRLVGKDAWTRGYTHSDVRTMSAGRQTSGSLRPGQ